MSHPILELDRLSVTFHTREGDVTALTDVSLSVDRGEVLVLVGESGSGKTVLANTLIGLLPGNTTVTGGIRIGGRDVADMSEKELRRLRAKDVALVPQGAASALNPVRKLEKQARATARNRDLSASVVESALRNRLASLDLSWDRVRDRYPHQLSGGMQQRLVTTLATVSTPSLLIADEPTNGLDTELVEATADALVEVQGDQAAMIVITHDLRLARRLGGNLGVLYGSALVEIGPTAQVMDAPTHPYTQGLVAALPERGGRPIPGLPPQLGDLPPGCPFAPRCPHKKPVCDQGLPAMVPVNAITTRCVLYDPE